MNKLPIIVSIDGNIGSGKSSILKYLENHFNNYCKSKNKNFKICFLQEPVSIWESITDNNNKTIIQKFYENNEKYAFPFQMMAYISRLSIFKKALNKQYDIIFTERSIYTDRNVFAKMLYNSNKINEIEYKIYNMWFDEFTDILNTLKTIYIKTKPDICDKRVKKRNREGEIITLDYLKDCNYYHEIWLNNINKNNILIINGNEDTNTSIFIHNDYFNNIMENIFNFISINLE